MLAIDPDANRPVEGSLEQRASLALKLLAVLNAAGIFLATIPASNQSPALQAVVFNATSGGLAVAYVVVARALDRGERWAVSAIRPMLLFLLAWGSYTFLSALVGGTFRIPIDMLAAAWVLLASAHRGPLTMPSRRGGVVLSVTVALMAIELVSQPLFSWGGYFDVRAPELNPSLVVDCGAPGAGIPERLTVAYEWSWSRGALLPNGEDQVVIGWNGDGADGHPLYVAAALPDTAKGINLGISGGVSAAMARAAAEQWRGMFMWRVDLGVFGIRPGRIEFVLLRTAAQPPEMAHLTIGASYTHLGVWRRDGPTVTCSW